MLSATQLALELLAFCTTSPSLPPVGRSGHGAGGVEDEWSYGDYTDVANSKAAENVLFERSGKLRNAKRMETLFKYNKTDGRTLAEVIAEAAKLAASSGQPKTIKNKSNASFSTAQEYEVLVDAIWDLHFKEKNVTELTGFKPEDLLRFFSALFPDGANASSGEELDDLFFQYLEEAKTKGKTVKGALQIPFETVRDYLFLGWDKEASNFEEYVSKTANEVMQAELGRLYRSELCTKWCTRFLASEASIMLESSVNDLGTLRTWENRVFRLVLPRLNEWKEGITHPLIMTKMDNSYEKSLDVNCRRLMLVNHAAAELLPDKAQSESERLNDTFTLLSKIHAKEPALLTPSEIKMIDFQALDINDPKNLPRIKEAYAYYLKSLIEPYNETSGEVINNTYFKARWEYIFSGPKSDLTTSTTLVEDLRQLTSSLADEPLDFFKGSFNVDNFEKMKLYLRTKSNQHPALISIMDGFIKDNARFSPSDFYSDLRTRLNERIRYSATVLNFIFLQMASVLLARGRKRRIANNQDVTEHDMMLKEIECNFTQLP